MTQHLSELSTSTALEAIPLGLIKSEPQVRNDYDEAELERLAKSLAQDGQMQPALVYKHPDGVSSVLIAGHRRFEAAKRAGLATLKALVFASRPTEGEIVRAQLVENTIRESLNPMDLAFAYQKLMTLEGITATELATILHVATSTVTRSIELTTLPENLQDQIRSRKLKPAHARELARIKDATKQAEVRAIIEDRKLNASQAATLVAGVIKPKKPGRPKTNVKSTWKVTGFEATYHPGKKLVLVPTSAGKAKTPDQLVGPLEQLLVKLKEELGRSQASATLTAQVQAAEFVQAQH